jgi:hypothetical protein
MRSKWASLCKWAVEAESLPLPADMGLDLAVIILTMAINKVRCVRVPVRACFCNANANVF